MANTSYNVAIVYCILITSFGIVFFSVNGFIEGRDFAAENYLRLDKGIIKTIESDDGDVIDCVDIYKQPALDNPLIKTIKLKPSSYPMGMTKENCQNGIKQLWQRSGECPEGTIPIRRTTEVDHQHIFPSKSFSNIDLELKSPNSKHEYVTAHVVTDNNKFFGGSVSINLWNPRPEKHEFSLSQIWLTSPSPKGLNTMEVGWKVSKDLQTRLFIYWTSNGYRGEGCYDLECAGFVQINRKIALGSVIDRVSTYNGTLYDLDVSVHKDTNGDWWLKVNDQTLGYWPGTLFTGFIDGAPSFELGGEVINKENDGRHTTTPMGSGHFPYEGYGKASYFRNVKFIDTTNTVKNADDLIKKLIITNPACYDINIPGGDIFYYGGMGYSPECP